MILLIRFVFGILSNLTPGSAAKLAFRLFCTPQRVKNRSTHHLDLLAKARTVFEAGMQHRVAYEGGFVAAYEFAPDSLPAGSTPKTCFVVHGWQSNSLLMSKFIQPLVASNWRVVMIDLPGHGQSGGRTCHIPMAVSALHAVSDKLGGCELMITHSLGGAVAAAALAGTLPDHPALPVQRLVTISSPDSVEKIFSNFFKMINLGKKSQQYFNDRVVELSGRAVADFNVGKQIAQTHTELLVIHAPDDKEISMPEAESIVSQVPNASLHAAEGYGHRRIVSADDVIQRAVDFLQSGGKIRPDNRNAT